MTDDIQRGELPATKHAPVGTSAPDASGRPWWEAQFRARTYFAKELGGPEKRARQHAKGRLTARERVERLVDPGSWREVGMFTGKASYDEDGRLVAVSPSNVVTGIGRVDDRDVVVVAEDFTVRGGATEAMIPEKWQHLERISLDYRIPLVRLVETAGGSVNLMKQMSSTKIPGYKDWLFVEHMGLVPVVGIALGAAAGLGAMRVVASHLSIMTKRTSYIFAGGPAVVKSAVGEDLTPHELGGAHVHARGSGVVDNEAEDEDDAIAQARRFLEYLPPSVFEMPPVRPADDPPDRREPALAGIVPTEKRRAYDMRRLLSLVFDAGSLFEMGRYYGRSQITMLGRLAGHPVAVLANDPTRMAGALTAESAEKLIRFVDLADTFHLPVVNLVDQPGTFVGRAAEASGAIRKGVRAQMAIEQARVPWISVFIRRAYGLAGSAYGPLTRNVNWRMAWPTANWGSLPIEGGIEAAYRRQLAEAADPDALRRELLAEFEYLENPFLTAEWFGIPDIIDPLTTRPRLCDWVRQAYRLLPEQLGPAGRPMRC